nr:unnamed protein product [Callosobruchus analis]
MKCVLCSAGLHPSCSLRIAGLVVIGRNNQVKCCNKGSEVRSAEALNSLLEAKEEVLRSKEEIICEL